MTFYVKQTELHEAPTNQNYDFKPIGFKRLKAR